MKKVIKGDMVYITLKKGEFPELSEEQEKMLEALKDRVVDTSDIPELEAEWFAKAQRGLFCRPEKEEIAFELDEDVLEWFKNQGDDYQERMNKALRAYMLEETYKNDDQ